MTTVELEYLCDSCSRPVADGQGSLYINFSEVRAHQSAHAEWEANRDPAGAIDIMSLLGLPKPATWHIHHDVCSTDGAGDYDIGVEQVRTWRDLLAWTAHLMEKNWLPDTDWRSVIGNAANGRDRRIVELARGDAA